MAQQNSFDIVSEVNLQEVDNAVNQAQKEIIQRYDFKGIRTSIELDQKEKKITLTTGDEFHLKSVVDILQSKLIKRGVPVKALRYGAIEPAANSSVRQIVTLQVGIAKEDAKVLTKLIKDSKMKVQTQIMEDQVRVSGKNKDDLQAVMALIRGQDFSFALQFVNYR
ncbi:MAG: YajQ family cyclic di-GMP-binding protein [Ignavibacteriae bacterium]|nr:MAG: YajQ family cyclic di-GMP-binding protein [Ignavibacteriota bacterium]